MILLLMLPMVALITGASWADLQAGLRRPHFHAALQLSLTTSLGGSSRLDHRARQPPRLVAGSGTTKGHRLVELLVNLPIVLPPAVMGLALLQTYGRQGLIGAFGLPISFSSWGVDGSGGRLCLVLYSRSSSAFRSVDMDLDRRREEFRSIAIEGFFEDRSASFTARSHRRCCFGLGKSIGRLRATPALPATYPVARKRCHWHLLACLLKTDLRTAMALALVLTLLCFGMLFLLRWTSGRLQS